MHRTAVAAPLVLVVLIGRAHSGDPSPAAEFPQGWFVPMQVNPAAAVMPPSAIWKLESDNTLNGTLDATTTETLVLESVNGQVTGRYHDRPVEASEQISIFTGQVIPGSPGIVTLRKDGPAGCTTVYLGQVGATASSLNEESALDLLQVHTARCVAGTFADNQGHSGDWRLTLVTEQFLEPAAPVPDELLYESVLGVYGEAIRGKRYPLINLRPPHRNLWTEEIQETIGGALTYEQVDYIGTARLVILEPGAYTIDIPGAGVEVRVNGARIEAGDVELKQGSYDVEIYTNHWGQPYLTYAEVTVTRTATGESVPFVNTAADIEVFRSCTIADRPTREVCEYAPPRVDLASE